MRVGKPAARVTDLRLDSAARNAAEAVKAAAGNPAYALGKFLIRLGDHLQAAAVDTRPPAPHPWLKKGGR